MHAKICNDSVAAITAAVFRLSMNFSVVITTLQHRSRFASLMEVRTFPVDFHNQFQTFLPTETCRVGSAGPIMHCLPGVLTEACFTGLGGRGPFRDAVFEGSLGSCMWALFHKVSRPWMSLLQS